MTQRKQAKSRKIVSTVDVREMDCSKPVVKIKNKLMSMKSGETVEVLAEEETSQDLQRIFGRIKGHEVFQKRDEGFVKLYITKK
ncbi:MAG TPA: sulfurtransferase TusA family protein [Thermoplasmata archaeon]|nr:sulfurtransferase TusA family protein [Thermoplasmata archaeon]